MQQSSHPAAGGVGFNGVVSLSNLLESVRAMEVAGSCVECAALILYFCTA
jgi:hypothetical protein